MVWVLETRYGTEKVYRNRETAMKDAIQYLVDIGYNFEKDEERAIAQLEETTEDNHFMVIVLDEFVYCSAYDIVED